MGDEKEKRGFWGLFRSKSSAVRNGKLGKEPPRRFSEGGRWKSELPANARDHERDTVASSRRRTRRSDPAVVKGKGREVHNDHQYGSGPLTQWPPSGMSRREELSLGQAMELISRGVPAFRGHKRPIPHVSDHYYALYASAAGNKGDDTDVANQHDAMTQLMTLRLLGPGLAVYPWETLEQSSYAFYFGNRPGTITINQWAALSSVIPPSIALRDPGVAPREVTLDRILERIKELERGLEDDDEELLYKNLYRRFLRDPDKLFSPHKALEKQITDLIMVLSAPTWIDFTNTRLQIVTRFIFDADDENHKSYLQFFHQLLLSMELDLRINSKHHLPEAKEKLLSQIPPTIQWSLALARRWRDYIRIESYGANPSALHLRFKLKRRQVKMLKRFAQMMKWPNLAATLNVLSKRDQDSTLDLVSSHAMAFFSGLVLPGPTFPFLIMNSLIDMDPDPATDDLALLTHLHPACGFQYRSSYTYWTAASIVGKVLAPTCHSVAGWVGPARPTQDLARSQIARIRTRKPRQRMTPEDVASMAERSDPLGPPAEVFPVKEYELVTPDSDGSSDGYPVDTVRIELLALRPCADKASEPGPTWFDASVQFAIDGASWPLRLAFDVNFISAWPCSDGPHPLFFDYAWTAVKADELVAIRHWNGSFGSGGGKSSATLGAYASARNSPAIAVGGGSSKHANGNGKALDATKGVEVEDEERVLVVEAFGVPDNEVLARAWCAHWGLSAVVADVGRTWLVPPFPFETLCWCKWLTG
ncbi:hypothetical protein GE09DRAFT_279919 [Coniochaeta sp. 2T2.1]|nr:hypothetical protein GE09DRAFT_279919 [Coniochaeta sp. 2T2.1]